MTEPEYPTHFGPWAKRAADALADEVAVLVRRRVIDARSPAADALLDYRDPQGGTPMVTQRADRIATLEEDLAEARAANDRATRKLGEMQHDLCMAYEVLRDTKESVAAAYVFSVAAGSDVDARIHEAQMNRIAAILPK